MCEFLLRLRNFIIAIIIAALFAGIFIYALNLENEDETSEPESVIINEFMAANNSTLTDENGDFSDWIEVYNPTDAAVKLFSFGLSDDSSKVKWTFPDISLQPGEFLVVFATNEATNSKNAAFLHTGFKLSASKDAIYLYLQDAIDSALIGAEIRVKETDPIGCSIKWK